MKCLTVQHAAFLRIARAPLASRDTGVRTGRLGSGRNSATAAGAPPSPPISRPSRGANPDISSSGIRARPTGDHDSRRQIPSEAGTAHINPAAITTTPIRLRSMTAKFTHSNRYIVSSRLKFQYASGLPNVNKIATLNPGTTRDFIALLAPHGSWLRLLHMAAFMAEPCNYQLTKWDVQDSQIDRNGRACGRSSFGRIFKDFAIARLVTQLWRIAVYSQTTVRCQALFSYKRNFNFRGQFFRSFVPLMLVTAFACGCTHYRIRSCH